MLQQQRHIGRDLCADLHAHLPHRPRGVVAHGVVCRVQILRGRGTEAVQMRAQVEDAGFREVAFGDRQTDSTERQTDGQTCRQTDKQQTDITDRQTDRQTAQTDRQTAQNSTEKERERRTSRKEQRKKK